MASTKNRQSGEATLSKAIAEREKWERALAGAQADAAAAAAVVPDSPEDLDRVGERSTTTQARLEAAARGLARANEQELQARRGLLRGIADDAAADRSQAEKDVRDLERKVDQHVRALLELDGVPYGPVLVATFDDGTTLPLELARTQHGSYTVPTPRCQQLARQVGALMVREAVLRFVADHGRTPDRWRDLLGTTPIRTEPDLQRAGIGGLRGMEAFTGTALADEARDYLERLSPVHPADPEPEDERPAEPSRYANQSDAYNLRHGYPEAVPTDSPAWLDASEDVVADALKTLRREGHDAHAAAVEQLL